MKSFRFIFCRYLVVWMIFFMLGLGTLLPWNFFMTATMVKHHLLVFIIAGDFNQANMKAVFPHFYQHVDFATERENTLDLVYTNIKDAFRAGPAPTWIWVLALSVFFTFTVTIGTFPAITADTRSMLADGGSWELYFIPVSCFLLFNLCDWTGRSLTAVCMWPGKDSLVLPVSVVARVVFVPLFMLCNVQPRLHLPVFFQHDGFFIAFMVLFAFSNGYLASLCMCYGPKNVLPHEAETAGAIMAFFLALGLASGAGISFLFRAVV
uniref:Solute carrier family 29 member 1 (Augustine blood group) n=1 Tax=Fundulus heteroclitus TaxID=8078 RepID=A0A3Q2QMH5_FUNHE